MPCDLDPSLAINSTKIFQRLATKTTKNGIFLHIWHNSIDVKQ